MSSAVIRLNGWFTKVAVGRQLSYRTVRTRLTVLYGGLFVLSGAGLMAIAYLLLVNAGFVFDLQPNSPTITGPKVVTPSHGAGQQSPPIPGMTTHPSALTMAYWRGVARCMHGRGFTAFPEPRASVPRRLGSVAVVSDRSGAILLFPARLDESSTAYSSAASVCGVFTDNAQQLALVGGTRGRVREQLLLQSAIALTAMSLLSLGLGWFVAGRVLQPLETSYEAQRQFVANASHELRAPLARQRALIQVALSDAGADAQSLRSAHERVLAAQQQREQIISGLLTLTRGQAGTELLGPVDLAGATAAVVRGHEAEALAVGVSVDTALAAGRIVGDERLVERLLSNLVTNAIRHNHAGGDVTVATGVRERVPFVAVTNTGPVVGPEHVERLLRPFERMGVARTGHDGGHGLGLAIVRAIADAHRAELRVTPQPQGGLRVEVLFPARSAVSHLPFAASWLRRGVPRTGLGD